MIAAMIAAIGIAGISASAEVRTWTDLEGREIEASMVGANDAEVVLKMKANGKEYKVPINHLSEQDLSYIAQWREANKDEGEGVIPMIPMAFENWDDEWPQLVAGDVTPEIEVVEEDEEAGRFVYRSARYEFICDAKLTKSAVKRFAMLFEATNDFVRALPLSMAKARQEKRHKVLLFETEETYYGNGAPAGTAGVYSSRKDIIMVPLTSLGVVKGAGGYRVDHNKANKVLVHEIVHQLTDKAYFAPGSLGWFVEGLADYVGLTYIGSSKFNVRGNQSAIEKFVTGQGEPGMRGRMLGDEIRAPDLRTFMLQDYDVFTENINFNYGLSLLIVYHFFHWDGDEDGKQIKDFLKALKQGKRGEEALEVLLDGRSWDELEQTITEEWRSRGIKLEFQ